MSRPDTSDLRRWNSGDAITDHEAAQLDVLGIDLDDEQRFDLPELLAAYRLGYRDGRRDGWE